MSTTLTTLAPKERLKELIKNNRILMLSKEKCKYCVIAKDALIGSHLDSYNRKIIDVNDDPELFKAAIELTGQKTVPNVWFAGYHIGGSDKVLEFVKMNPNDGWLDLHLPAGTYKMAEKKELAPLKLDDDF